MQGDVTSEVVQVFAPWVTQTVRLTAGSPVLEVQYTVGPIPVDDKQGKEVVTRYSSAIESAATWYTDSNGREWQKRQRNYRPAWNWTATQPVRTPPLHTAPPPSSTAHSPLTRSPLRLLSSAAHPQVAGNYFPVNAATWLADGTSALSVCNDRSQGGTSLHDGELELMVHRRLTMDDGRGVGEPLSEPGLDGKGLIITGTHYLQLTPVGGIAAATRHVQQRVYAPLHWSVAPLSGSVSDYLATHNGEWTALQTPLPLSVELMSLYRQRNGTALVRLAHNFGALDGEANARPVEVDLSTLLAAAWKPTAVTEVSLTANTTPDQIKRLTWKTSEVDEEWEGVKRVREMRAATVTINPAEVRTFVLSF